MEISGCVSPFPEAEELFCVGGRVPTKPRLPAKSQFGILLTRQGISYHKLKFEYILAEV